MWGVCLDSTVINGGLSQMVVHYEIKGDTAIIFVNGAEYITGIDKMKRLSQPPKFTYGQKVVVTGRTKRQGTIGEIRWHFDKGQYFYKIQIADKLYKTRYFEEELALIKE